MSRRAATWLAWSLAALSSIMAAASVVLYIASGSMQPPGNWGTGGASGVLIFVLPFLAFPLVGALIASNRPNNPIGWICLAVGIIWMINAISSSYGVYGLLVRPGSVPFPAALGSLAEWIWAPAVGLLGIYLILLFPNGSLPSRRWRPVAWLSGAVIVLVSAGFALSPGPMDSLPGIRNPFGLENYPWVADATLSVVLLLPLCMLVSAVSLLLRFLRSGGEEREQIKWLAFAASILGLGWFSYVIPANILPDAAGGVDRLWVNLWEDALTLSLAGVPVAVGIAILRHRLFDIDIIIRRTLIYSVLTLMLGFIYLGCIIVSRILIAPLTGGSELAIVASTLAIAALFNPLRRRIQHLIDRRFYRRKYDAARVLAAFAATTRDETDLQRLTVEMLRVVDDTMQPEFAGLWLREPTTRSALDSARPDSTPP